jgi:capsular exopolysaccharide synthesis family protein
VVKEAPSPTGARTSTDLEHVRAAIARHPWIWLGITFAAIAAAVGANRFLPPVYEATTTVVYEATPENVPTIRVAIDPIRHTYVQNQIEEIESRAMAEEVLATLPEEHRRAFLPLSGSTADGAVERLQRCIDARPVKDSDVIKVRVRAQDPLLAAAVANTLTGVLRHRNVSVRRQEADALYRFLDEQIGQVTARLGDSEDSLHAFKQTNQVVQLDKEAAALLERSTDLEVRLNQVVSERKAQQARLAAVRQEIGQHEGNLENLADPTQPWLAQLRQKLVDLEVRHATLSVQDYPSDHPQLVKLEREIEETRGRLATEAARMAQHQTVADPLARRNDLIVETLNLEMDLDALRAKERALLEAIKEYEGESASLPAKELELLRLSRQQQLYEKLYLMLNEKREEARIAQAGEIGNARVLDPARVPTRPIRPRPLLNLFLALVFGTTSATMTCVGLKPSARRIHTLADAERALDLRVLGEVPHIPPRWMRALERARRGAGPAAGMLPAPRGSAVLAMEAYRTLAAHFTYLDRDSRPCSLLVTSAVPGEGKSTTALHLALFAAESGARTLLVDADLRRPLYHRLLGLQRHPGLTDVLRDAAPHDSVVTAGVLVPTLNVVAAGASVRDPMKLVASPRFAAWMEHVRRLYDLVVVDTSPVLAVYDAVAMARCVDATLLVVQSERSAGEDCQRAVRALRDGGAALAGVVLNDVDWRRVYGRGYYYGRVQRYYAKSTASDMAVDVGEKAS